MAASSTTRRTFLTAITAASYGRVLGANDRIQIGFVGYGLINQRHVADFKAMPDVDCAAVCEVYKPRLEAGLAQCGPAAKGYSDFRRMYENKDLQGIVVGTPNHWHALNTILACAAGKDVYVEKPLSVFIRESRWMVTAARRYGRMVTVGTQRKTGAEIRAAREIIASGRLGGVKTVRAASCRNVFPGFGVTRTSDPPDGLDYNMWLGPTPLRPYTKHRALYHFRWFWDYSGGQMTNLGSHDFDKVQFIMRAKAPTQVFSTGGRAWLEDDGETPDSQDTLFVYPEFTMLYSIREANALADITGIRFLGNKGSLVLRGGSYEVIPEMKGEPLNQIPGNNHQPPGGVVSPQVTPTPWIAAEKSPVTSEADLMTNNERNWLESIRSRRTPFCDIEDGHQVNVACHLANISLRLRRAVNWDPEEEVILGDREAAAMLERPYRKPWNDVLAGLRLA